MPEKSNTLICDCGSRYSPNINKYKDTRVKCTKCIRATKAADVKSKCVAYLGGSCVDCGFRGESVAFDFDHMIPALKEFKISGHYIFRWSELQQELDKTELRCCRCHRIRHYLEEYPDGK